jgi:hypothetical protein
MQVVGATEAQALAAAMLRVGERVQNTAVRALLDSPELARRVAAIQQPQTLYTLGRPWEAPHTIWSIPFYVYITGAA